MCGILVIYSVAPNRVEACPLPIWLVMVLRHEGGPSQKTPRGLGSRLVREVFRRCCQCTDPLRKRPCVDWLLDPSRFRNQKLDGGQSVHVMSWMDTWKIQGCR